MSTAGLQQRTVWVRQSIDRGKGRDWQREPEVCINSVPPISPRFRTPRIQATVASTRFGLLIAVLRASLSPHSPHTHRKLYILECSRYNKLLTSAAARLSSLWVQKMVGTHGTTFAPLIFPWMLSLVTKPLQMRCVALGEWL